MSPHGPIPVARSPVRTLAFFAILLALPLTAPHASAASALSATDPIGDDGLFAFHDYPVEDPTGHVAASLRIDTGCHAASADIVAVHVAVEDGILTGSLELLDAEDPWLSCEDTVAFPVYSSEQRIRLREADYGAASIDLTFETDPRGEEACAQIGDPAVGEGLEICDIGELAGNVLTWQIPLEGTGTNPDGHPRTYSLTGFEMLVRDAWAISYTDRLMYSEDFAHAPGTLSL